LSLKISITPIYLQNGKVTKWFSKTWQCMEKILIKWIPTNVFTVDVTEVAKRELMVGRWSFVIANFYVNHEFQISNLYGIWRISWNFAIKQCSISVLYAAVAFIDYTLLLSNFANIFNFACTEIFHQVFHSIAEIKPTKIDFQVISYSNESALVWVHILINLFIISPISTIANKVIITWTLRSWKLNIRSANLLRKVKSARKFPSILKYLDPDWWQIELLRRREIKYKFNYRCKAWKRNEK
jgi:hypothetical protein